MAAITVALINELRQLTNAGMMDCKKALTDTNGDMEAAVKILREKGLAIQVKRADKESKEGIIGALASADSKIFAMAEVNTETDFVAKTDNFKAFAALVTKTVLETGKTCPEELGATLKDPLMTIVSQTGENVKIRRAAYYVQADNAIIESYIHMGGKVGVLVEVSAGKPETLATDAFKELVHDLALQIAAAAPRYLVSSEVPEAAIENEKEIARNSDRFKGKPANIVENALKGIVNKFYSEVCLVNQPFVKEPKQTVTDVVKACEKTVGDSITITRFVRFQLGAA
ncbi:MAG TPA: translation elongation factor Ts [Kiritimatiellia bacterium]|nr:translation elongation factor Ts [Kiritimatiellia bacterium]HRU71437.1 translation elongation factor Ts [Kiritimatiellia bacterium]